jgi:glutaconate CoA-transferase, subunit A
MLDKTMTLQEICSELRDGMTLGIGGWGPRRKPMALVRAILRTGLRDLTLVTYGGPDAGMLCAAGRVMKITYGFVSLDAIPVEPFFKKAREAGAIEAREIDEGMLLTGLRAAGMRLPFLPTRVGLGTDVMKMNPDFRTVASPYGDGEVLLAMPALALDAALVHVDRADKLGNTQTLGPDPYFDAQFARAAKRCFVTCEELVERLDIAHPEDARFNQFERYFVAGVAEARFGAHPTSNPPAYGWDLDHLREYSTAAGQENGWDRYSDEFVAPGEVAYLRKVGGIDRLAKLPPPVF